MKAQPLLFTHNLRLAAGGRSVVLLRRQAIFLIALERCRPGVVTDKLLCQLGCHLSVHRAGGWSSVLRTVHELRTSVLGIGLGEPILRVPTLGYRLTIPITIIDTAADLAEAA